jgi:hypothetical protein
MGLSTLQVVFGCGIAPEQYVITVSRPSSPDWP